MTPASSTAPLDSEAVHYAPHGHLDVQSIGCDFLACSPYKFFGPHAGTPRLGRVSLVDCFVIMRDSSNGWADML